jgi:hypothetical protein
MVVSNYSLVERAARDLDLAVRAHLDVAAFRNGDGSVTVGEEPVDASLDVTHEFQLIVVTDSAGAIDITSADCVDRKLESGDGGNKGIVFDSNMGGFLLQHRRGDHGGEAKTKHGAQSAEEHLEKPTPCCAEVTEWLDR